MLGAGLERARGFDDPLFAAQVAGERFAAPLFLKRLLLALDGIGLDDRLSFGFRFGACRLKLFAILERQPALLGVGQHALLAAPALNQPLDQLAKLVLFGDQLLALDDQLVVFDDQLVVFDRERFDRGFLRGDRGALRENRCSAMFEVARQFAARAVHRFAHGEHDNVRWREAQDLRARILKNSPNSFRDPWRRDQLPASCGAPAAPARR